jgi:hypothetical protein
MPSRHVPYSLGRKDTALSLSYTSSTYTRSSTIRTSHSFFENILYSFDPSITRLLSPTFFALYIILVSLSLFNAVLESAHFSHSFTPHSICQLYINSIYLCLHSMPSQGRQIRYCAISLCRCILSLSLPSCSSAPRTSHSFFQDVLYNFHPSNSRSMSEPSKLIHLHPSANFSDSFIPKITYLLL